MDSGHAHIAVPDRAGHDDLCSALALAVSESNVSSLPVRATSSSAAYLRLPGAPITRRAGGEARLGDRSGGRKTTADRKEWTRHQSWMPGPRP